MIISCNNCNKKFDIDSNVIPKNGRLLQCSSCNYKWFFKKEIINEPISTIKINKSVEKPSPLKSEMKPFNEETKFVKTAETINLEPTETEIFDTVSKDKIETDENKAPIIKKSKNRKNYNILGLIIVFIISFIALIVVLDTFQKPVSSIAPNIEFLLYSLYETIKDILLFFSNLI